MTTRRLQAFARNSLEQLLINFANEKLQHHFYQYIFRSEICPRYMPEICPRFVNEYRTISTTMEEEECAAEGVECPKLDFADNAAVMALLQAVPSGLLSLINDEARRDIYPRHIPEICTRDICPRYIPEICPRYTRDIPEIYPRYTPDIPQIYPRYTQLLLVCKGEYRAGLLRSATYNLSAVEPLNDLPTLTEATRPELLLLFTYKLV